jgi:ribosomal protein L37E
MSKFFGPAHLKFQGEESIATPVGAVCILCDERIAEGDMGSVYAGGTVAHYECTLRSIAGSVGHQLGRCSCYGGTEEDPPGLTHRLAAKAAARIFHWKDENKLPPIVRPPVHTTFTFVASDAHLGIKCERCGLTSYNPNDIAYLYCGKCNAFHTPKGK